MPTSLNWALKVTSSDRDVYKFAYLSLSKLSPSQSLHTEAHKVCLSVLAYI